MPGLVTSAPLRPGPIPCTGLLNRENGNWDHQQTAAGTSARAAPRAGGAFGLVAPAALHVSDRIQVEYLDRKPAF